MKHPSLLPLACVALLTGLCAGQVHADATGWLNWRGPQQNGVSHDTALPTQLTLDETTLRWTHALAGRGAPVIANGRLFAMGYHGDGPDLRETLICLDAETGEKIWERGYSDFISDIVYNRYSIGAPCVDPETGNVYAMTSPGLLLCFTADGEPVWEHSMMETFGRLTFPNGRTGSPTIDGDLVIVNVISSNWGREGPGRNRFYAFDKRDGRLVWSSTPGVGPQDSSFSTPVFEWRDGLRVMYCGTGCGNVVAINARTGDPLWRFQLSRGGINASVLLHDDKVIAIHGKENLDSSEMGRMVAIRAGARPAPGEDGPVVLGPEYELWRADLMMFTSSPTLVDDRVYQVTHTGDLCSVNVETGEVLWQHKIDNSQLHASPLYANGHLYVPMWSGGLHVFRPDDDGPNPVSSVQLEGDALGAPAAWNGRLYVHTVKQLYCFGAPEVAPQPVTQVAQPAPPQPGEPAILQPVPAEVVLRPGESQAFEVRRLDANGLSVDSVEQVEWAAFVPPTALVRARMDATFAEGNQLVAGPEAKMSAGSFEARAGDLRGYMRGRVLPDLPYHEDFDGFTLSETHQREEGVQFAYPPLAWIGARFKWEIRERDGAKVLAQTLDNVLFQRAVTFIGPADMREYTVAADVMTDGTRRIMSNVGLVNQRYVIALIGNWRQIEVSSNHDRVKVAEPFDVRPNVWYRLVTSVEVHDDGSGVVRGKAWQRDQEEPEAWTIEVPLRYIQPNGAPGLFGFSPQSRERVYIDNISVTPND